jgi:hypothetical protein
MTSKISQRAAEKLWDELRTGLLNAELSISKIIDTRAWEPIGFHTFAEAWRDRLGGVSLASEVRPHVVYQLAAEGFSPCEIADAVKGISPQGAESLIRQRSNGVPAGHAVVREHHRRPSGPPSRLSLDVGPTMLQEFRRIAAVQGLTAEEIALEAVRARFRELAVVTRKKRSA